MKTKYRFEVHCFCKETYAKFGGTKEGGFPENSYFYNDEEKIIECLSDLVKNRNSGIWITELIQNDFDSITKEK